jgi:DNA topoisomerase-1
MLKDLDRFPSPEQTPADKTAVIAASLAEALSSRVPAAETPPVAYVSSGEPGISRRRAGNGFVYRAPDGRRVGDAEVVARIRALAIPPAWRDVWICMRAEGHIQAIGFDARGRRQYRYHADFRQLREGAKFGHLLTFAETLPRLRERVATDMSARGLGRDKVLATVVHLLETTMIRVGNRAYERTNHSYGLTTLEGDHVTVEGSALRFHFTGKSGKVWRLDVRDRRVAKIVRACQHLPGQTLFGYLDDAGRQQAVTSCDVNAYLKQVTNRDITAKDFRTWAGTVMAAKALAEAGPADGRARAEKTVRAMIKQVAARLGNTPTVCRASYIHPGVIEAYLDGELSLDLPPSDDKDAARWLRPEEAGVLEFLRRDDRGAAASIVRGVGKRSEPSALMLVKSRSAAHREIAMPRGDKSKYTDKQERKADHIAESYESRGLPEKEAERRAWATVNKDDGGGKKPGGSGRASGVRSAVDRSASARKATAARKRHAAHA